MTNKIIIFCLGIFVGGFLVAKYPYREKSDLELVEEELAEFNRVEAVCGKGNVRDKCKYGYCDSGFGLTCTHWRKAAFEAEMKNDE